MARVFFDTRKNIHALNAAYTVLQSDSGKHFMVSNSSGGAYEITLPVAANLQEGWFCKFVVVEETPGNAVTIAAGSAILDGVQKDAGGDAANSTAGTAVSNLVIGTTAQQGDVINLFTDGTTYYFECLSGINNAITTS
jgi:hypothetical protein